MNRAIRVISILMLVVLLVGALAVPSLAVDPNEFSPDTGNATGITNLFNSVIGIVQVVGTGIAIIMLIVIAIKYLVASPEGKSDIKKSALVYVVAAVILFAAVNILAVIQEWAQDLEF